MSDEFRTADCHPDRSHYGNGLCNMCYQRQDSQISYQLMRRYGLTLEERDRIMVTQDGKCAICQRSFGSSDGRGTKSLVPHVDHDHATGLNRGLLCSPCNTAIGLFRDNTDNLRRAEAYLGLSNNEQTLRVTADALALAERQYAEEVLLRVSGGQTTWNAQRMADVTHGVAVHLARATYEIALARLRRA